MKVIMASTPEQQEYVINQINHLYEDIFPCFFSQDYIQKLKEFKLMNIPNIDDFTMPEILEVTAAIQTISTILEQLAKTKETLNDYHQAFSKNARILSKYEIDFPFQLGDFQMENSSFYYSQENSFYI